MADRRRCALARAAAVSAVLLGCLPSPTAALGSQPGEGGYVGMSLPPGFRAFAATSPWNTPIAEGAQEDPGSILMILNLRDKARILRGSYRNWTIPVFVIDAARGPKCDVRTTDEHLSPEVDPDDNGVAEGLPLPEGIWPDPQKDGHMVLVDPAARKSWEFSRARRLAPGHWVASRIAIWDLDGPGFRAPFSGKYWWTSGAMGAGMPLIAGVIRPEEIRAGEIRHALLFASPVNRRQAFPGGGEQLCGPPASRTDGQGVGIDYIPEGARLQLDPTLDLETLRLSPGAKVVARALQRYGMINGMGSEHFKLFFQNLGSEAGEWQRLIRFDDLERIPVERFRVLKCNLVTRSEPGKKP